MESHGAPANDGREVGNIVKIDDEKIKGHLDSVVRGTVEETLNALLEAEAEQLCGAGRYERTESRRDTRAGHLSGLQYLARRRS